MVFVLLVILVFFVLVVLDGLRIRRCYLLFGSTIYTGGCGFASKQTLRRAKQELLKRILVFLVLFLGPFVKYCPK